MTFFPSGVQQVISTRHSNATAVTRGTRKASMVEGSSSSPGEGSHLQYLKTTQAALPTGQSD